MKIHKFKTYELNKCYAVAPLIYNQKLHIIVAAEKQDACLLFSADGDLEETIWEEPGGTMSIVPLEERNGEFLATQMFYSPNDSKNAQIVYVKPMETNQWRIQVIAKVPFLHRFDILKRGGVQYIIACELKTAHAYKDDWSSPGRVSVAVLPDNMDKCEGEPLIFRSIKIGMLKNHGYYRMTSATYDYSIISADNGVFRFIPPETKEEEWTIDQLIDIPASDATLMDLDQDGELELVVITPFHGDFIKIYKQKDGKYMEVFSYERPTEFLHAIWGGNIGGKPVAILGHRKGRRDILAISYQNGYKVEVLDSDVGSANIMHYQHNGGDYLVSANREINEIAFYRIELVDDVTEGQG